MYKVVNFYAGEQLKNLCLYYKLNILRVLGVLTSMVNLGNNANDGSCAKCGILVVQVYFKSASW